jgi:hypothetical protein
MQQPRCRPAIKPWLLIAGALLLAPLVALGGALAQGGSTGGNIGQQNKSVSGGQEPSAAPPPARRASPKPSRSAPARAQAAPAAAGSWSGAWKGVSTGGCIPTWSWTLQISDGGDISGSGAVGKVARGGGASGTMTVLGVAYHFAGRFSAGTAAGTWKRDDGCAGAWTATR